MAARTRVAAATKATILELLGACNPVSGVAEQVGLTAGEVVDVAANHGYPDPEKMTLAAAMIRASLDRQEAPPPRAQGGAQ